MDGNGRGGIQDGRIVISTVQVEIFPQAKVMLEYRGTEAQINFDNRILFGQPFFILIDELWKTINLRNGSVPVREGSYIFDIPFFNEEVIREIVNRVC